MKRLHLERLNTAQRIVLWLGSAFLLLAVMYPEFKTGYDPYVDGKRSGLEIGVVTKREFVLDGLAPPSDGDFYPHYNPELRRLFRKEDNDDLKHISMPFSRLQVWDLCLQALAIVALTAGGLWAFRKRPD